MSDNRGEEVAVCAILVATSAVVISQRKQKRCRMVWTKEWFLKREEKGAYNMLLEELRMKDADSYRHYLRMNTDTFQASKVFCFSRVRPWGGWHYAMQLWKKGLKSPLLRLLDTDTMILYMGVLMYA